MSRRRWAEGIGAAVLVLALVLEIATHDELPEGSFVAAAADDAIRLATTTTGVPAPATTPPPPPTEPPTTAAAAPPTTIPPREGAWTAAPYSGLGVWLDVYDWTHELTGGHPRVDLADIDYMANLGIQTIFIQTAHRRSAWDVIEPERLLAIINQAHARGMWVVAWYLPTLENTDVDLRRLLSAATLPVDGLGVDIESLAVADHVDRNRRLLELSEGLRRNMTWHAISAITPDAVHLQVVNPGFWPAFPWPELASSYDVIVPMSYWSIRKAEWRQGERYVWENIERIRAATGRPDIPIHVAGGIANGISLDDVAGMVHAIHMRGAVGGSLYDWNTSQTAQWDLLRAIRVG